MWSAMRPSRISELIACGARIRQVGKHVGELTTAQGAVAAFHACLSS
jgi:hypothetical protein